MPNGKVYDPLVGQWMSPQWEGMLARATEPQQLHLYRFNGNDPINVMPTRQYLKGMLLKKCISYIKYLLCIVWNMLQYWNITIYFV